MGQLKKERPKCLKCGNTVKRLNNLYCSKKCTSTRYNTACEYCGKSFVTHPSASGKFCSRKCCNDWQVGQEHVERKTKPCSYCGLDFFGTEKELEDRTFCSRICSDKNKTKKAGHNSDLNRKCTICGTLFVVEKPCKKQKCCSYKCGRKIMWKEHNEKIEQLLPEIKTYRKTHTKQETSDKYNMSQSVLTNWGVIGPESERRLSCPNTLTDEQQEMINGNLLGDGCLSYIKSPGSNSHFSIGQKGDRHEYVESLFNIYQPFASRIFKNDKIRKPSKIDGKINHDIENWNREYTNSAILYTIAHPIFTDMRHKWYKDPETKRSQKIIPTDLRLTWRTAAVWMCDDGSNYFGPRKRRAVLYTDCFTEKDVLFLIKRLYDDLGVVARLNHRNNNPIIGINGDEWYKFINGIKPFVTWECFQYKCINQNKINRSKSGIVGIHKCGNRWAARISKKHIGTYDTIEEASKARKEYINQLERRSVKFDC